TVEAADPGLEVQLAVTTGLDGPGDQAGDLEPEDLTAHDAVLDHDLQSGVGQGREEVGDGPVRGVGDVEPLGERGGRHRDGTGPLHRPHLHRDGEPPGHPGDVAAQVVGEQHQ